MSPSHCSHWIAILKGKEAFSHFITIGVERSHVHNYCAIKTCNPRYSKNNYGKNNKKTPVMSTKCDLTTEEKFLIFPNIHPQS